MMRDKKQRSNKSVLKAYDNRRTTHKPKYKENQEERQKRRRAQMLEALDKHRKWISLWDVENGRAQ